MEQMRLFVFVCTAVMVIGCSKGKEAEKKALEAKPAKAAAAKAEKAAAPKVAEAPKAAAPAPKPAAAPADAIKDDGKVVTVALTGNDQMKYNLTEIKVAAGRTVKVTLTHVGKLAAAAMGTILCFEGRHRRRGIRNQSGERRRNRLHPGLRKG